VGVAFRRIFFEVEQGRPPRSLFDRQQVVDGLPRLAELSGAAECDREFPAGSRSNPRRPPDGERGGEGRMIFQKRRKSSALLSAVERREHTLRHLLCGKVVFAGERGPFLSRMVDSQGGGAVRCLLGAFCGGAVGVDNEGLAGSWSWANNVVQILTGNRGSLQEPPRTGEAPQS